VLIRELSVPDSYEVTPVIHADSRGAFLEWYRFDRLAEVTGHPIVLRQANTSISHRGVVRGIHFADFPLGQAKYVTVTHGAVIDYVVDVRVGSPTFGQWDSVRLDAVDRKAVYLSEGLGHAFVSLTHDTVVSYLVTDTYNPSSEHAISPLDATISLSFPTDAGQPLVSPTDLAAPTLMEALKLGLLPTWAAARSYYAELTEAAS